jgi:hypothetical protein
MSHQMFVVVITTATAFGWTCFGLQRMLAFAAFSLQPIADMSVKYAAFW